jgi:hypothetical protein
MVPKTTISQHYNDPTLPKTHEYATAKDIAHLKA